MAARPLRKSPAVVLITGTSSGIGLAIARHLAECGHTVYGCARSEAADETFTQLHADVRDLASVRSVIRTIIERESKIDVVVNCAGYGLAGAVEDTSLEEAQAQFDTNFFGTLRVCQEVLPHMREQGQGRIINISSIAADIPLPFQSFYSASKAAVESLTLALRLEVRAFGIQVAAIAPGDLRTSFSANRRQLGDGESPYSQQATTTLQVMETDEQNGPAPEVVARLLEKLVTTRRLKPRYTAGMLSQRSAVALKAWMPATLFETVFASLYKIDKLRPG